MADPTLSRIERLVGAAGLESLRRSFVVVVGLGAVGGFAAEALARAGVGRLRLVDFDTLRPSNLNRQLLALRSTLGRPKVEVAAARIADIQPGCRVEALELFAHRETLDQVLGGGPDLVLDAIDSLAPKVALLEGCLSRGLPVLAAMGAALRTDPTRVRVGPLAKVSGCPVAAGVRKRLRRRGLPVEIPCVYSTEPTDRLPPEAVGPESDDPDELKRGRGRRELGSLPTLTGIFGLVLANEALRRLLGPHWPGPE